MAELSTSGVVRDILTGDPELPSDEVIRRAKSKGLRATDEQIPQVHQQPAEPDPSKGRGRRGWPRRRPARVTPPKAAPAVSASAATTPGTRDLAGVLGNVALVNAVVGLCGGVENARQTAEAVQAWAGLEAFLQHLELVATIRGGEAAG